MDNNESTPNLLPASKMAELCGVADSTLKLWYYRGIIPGHVSKSRKPRFDPDRVFAALKEYARNNPDQPWHSKIPTFADV